MNDYKVHSKELLNFLDTIVDFNKKERYGIFFSLHEDVHYAYSMNNQEPTPKLRTAAEAFCKLVLFEYIPNADALFGDKDTLCHTYRKNLATKKIEEFNLNDRTSNGYRDEYTDLGQYAYAFLFKQNQLEDGKNSVYNTIKDCYEKVYKVCNTDAKDHPVPVSKQTCFSCETIYSQYFTWLRTMIDVCPDGKLTPLKNILPFENNHLNSEVVSDLKIEKLLQADSEFKSFCDYVREFKHESGKKYILLTSCSLSEELKNALSNVAWNMVVDFDPNTQNDKGLYSIMSELWEGKRQMLYTDIETNGDKITYWVEANGNNTSKITFTEKDIKKWRSEYLTIIENKVLDLAKQLPSGDIVIIDLFSNSKLPIAFYKKAKFPKNTSIIRLLTSDDKRIDEDTKDDIDPDIEEFAISQEKISSYLKTLTNVGIESLGVDYIVKPIDVQSLSSYGIECVPIIPQNTPKSKIAISFCSGNRIKWDELYSGHDIERMGYKMFYDKIAHNIKRKTKFVEYIVHKPCSGGTTTALRLAFDLRNKEADIASKCYVVYLSEIKNSTIAICKKLREFLEDKLPVDTMLVIIIDRTISEENVKIITEQLNKSTYLASIIRITYDQIKRPDALLIRESLYESEKQDFIKLYSYFCNVTSIQKQEEVVEFPLSVQYYNNTKSVDGYVLEWQNKIDLKYKDCISKFSLLISVASLYLYDYDRYVSTEFTDRLFSDYGTNIWSILPKMTKTSKEAFEKLFEIEVNDENVRTCRIRPKFSIFAQSIIRNSHLGVYDISNDYLFHISEWNNIYEKNKYLYDVFTKTSDYEIDDKKVDLSDKVSNFFKDNFCDSETILAVYRHIIKYFPNDETCLLSYAQFLYNKAYYEDKDFHDGISFNEAEDILLTLVDKDNDDNRFLSLVYQSLGVLYFRKIGVLRIKEELSNDLYKKALEYCNICIENCDKCLEFDPTNTYGLVTKAQTIKSVLNLTKQVKGYNDWNFCENEVIYQDLYLDFIDACSKIAKHCPEEDESITNNGLKLVQLYSSLDDFKRKLNGNEDTRFSFEKYANKIDNVKDDKLKIIYGCRLYDTVVSSKRNLIRENLNLLKDTQISRIEDAVKYNARKGISGSYERLLNLYIFNNRTDRTISDVLELLKEWSNSAKTADEKLWINYYLMVLYGIQILNEGRANEGLLKRFNEAKINTAKFCDEAHQSENGTYAFLFYRNSTELHCISESKEFATPVQGKIHELNERNRRKGTALLDCGLIASFSAKDNKYNDADVDVTRIEGRIGFRFNGLGLYKQDIVDDDDLSQIDNNNAPCQNRRIELPESDTNRFAKLAKKEKKQQVENANDQTLELEHEKEITNYIQDEIVHGTICNGLKSVIGPKGRATVDNKEGFAVSPKICDYESIRNIVFQIKVGKDKTDPSKPWYYAINIKPEE